jgi:ABC-type microcin C transport system permease subunit YejB
MPTRFDHYDEDQRAIRRLFYKKIILIILTLIAIVVALFLIHSLPGGDVE